MHDLALPNRRTQDRDVARYVLSAGHQGQRPLRIGMECFGYPVLLKRAAGGGYVVTCCDLPALITQGENREDALAHAADAMEEVVATVMKLGLDVPVRRNPRRTKWLVPPPVETVAKAALYSTLREAKISKVQLERQLGIDAKGMQRLLDPRDPSKLPPDRGGGRRVYRTVRDQSGKRLRPCIGFDRKFRLPKKNPRRLAGIVNASEPVYEPIYEF